MDKSPIQTALDPSAKKACVLVGDTRSGKTQKLVKYLQGRERVSIVYSAVEKYNIFVADGKDGFDYKGKLGESSQIFGPSNGLHLSEVIAIVRAKALERVTQGNKYTTVFFVIDELDVWFNSQEDRVKSEKALSDLLGASLALGICVFISTQNYENLPAFLKTHRILLHRYRNLKESEFADHSEMILSLNEGEYVEFVNGKIELFDDFLEGL